MIEYSFIHLSDIHFVKSSDNPADIDRDLREAIIHDLQTNARGNLGAVKGILISGDIGFSGACNEYDKAKEYLLKLTEILSINPSDIYCVPGNHDIDRSVSSESPVVSQTQRLVAQNDRIDTTDIGFSKAINDRYYKDVLFEPLKNYNDFVSRFDCDLSPARTSWHKDFLLDNSLTLRICGICSCYLPDYPNGTTYVGQYQIPPRIQDTAVMLMCHHPPACWRFKDEMIDRINKRADVQLYGHMHMQTTEMSQDNAIIFSGATHPQRTEDWVPRYNWIKMSSYEEEGDRLLCIKLYPRILSDDRDHFRADNKILDNGLFIRHTINIDKKRRQDLEDVHTTLPNTLIQPTSLLAVDSREDNKNEGVNERELIYQFYDLSVVRQVKILGDLDLLSDDDRGIAIDVLLTNSLQRAKARGKYGDLLNCIKEHNINGG